jgi:hypothetical protein
MSTHSYATLQQLSDPGYLGAGIINQGYGVTLQRMLENASEEIDHTCYRHFHCLEGTYLFDGSGRTLILSEDILSISSFLLDLDGDGTYETTLNSTDYTLYPLNEWPKTYIKMNYSSGQGGFASGITAGVKITGVFGHGNGQSATPYYATSITGTVANATDTTLTLSAEGTIQTGHTIRVESEQMYVTAVSSNGDKTVTVTRGVNGTIAAAHAAKTISIYHYIGPITEATLILATAWWKQRENPANFMAGDSTTGTYTITKSIEDIIKKKVDDHIRKVLM